MPTPARYRRLEDTGSVNTIALVKLEGGLEDPVAAWIRRDGRACILVVAPAERRTWPGGIELQFRSLVGQIAASPHPLLENAATVSIVFDPPQESGDDGTVSDDEIVMR